MMKAKEKQKELFEDKLSYVHLSYSETVRTLKLNQAKDFVVPWQMGEAAVEKFEFL